MKKILSLVITVLLVFALTACRGSSNPTLEGNLIDEKNMEITANKADPGDYVLSGSLVLDDGEQIYYDHKLESGEIEIQFIPTEEEQSDEEVPDYEGTDPVMTLDLSENGGGSSYFESGSYMVKVSAVGKSKAVGTVTLNIKPIEEQ